MCFRRHGDCRDFRQRWRILLERSAADDGATWCHRHHVVVDRQRNHPRRAAQHQRRVGEVIVELRDRLCLRESCLADVHRTELRTHESTSATIDKARARSSRVATSGGSMRIV
jgi:hypothetical protein